MTEVPPTPPESELDAPPLPWYRNPWIWGVIVGLVLMPALRPFMRHIPDAPPVVAAVPEYRLHLPGGGVSTSSQLRGRVYVLGIYGTACEPGCGEVLPALTRLSGRLVQFERGITVVAVRLVGESVRDSSQAADVSQEWLQFDTEQGNLDTTVAGVLAGHIDGFASDAVTAVELARRGRVFIIDALGNLRGHYGIDEAGLDEVYHRAQHVLRDHRKDGEVPR